MNSRRITVGVACLALASLVLVQHASAATTARFAGQDRYGTAANISGVTFGDGAEIVYIATGESFADSLAGGAAAAQENGPILLASVDELPETTRTELNRLVPDEVRVLGGTGAISEETFAAIEDATTAETVIRIAGTNRYTTAVEVSQKTFEPGVAAVFIVGGTGAADALSAGAAAASQGGPVLLVQQDTIPDTVAAELGRLDPGRITIVGGTGAVSAGVEAALAQYTDGNVGRLAGPDRFRTSAAVSFAHFVAPVDKVFLANGFGFADALAGTPAAAAANGPLLLTKPNCIPESVQTEIDRLAPNQIVLLGGSGSLGAGVEGGDVCEDLGV
jgi:putative cell wall-binding protein